MTEAVENGAMYAKPMLTTAIARALGFGRKSIVRDDEDDAWPGHLSTYVEIRLDFMDRLRVLATGRVQVHTRHRIDQPVNTCQSRSEISVY